MQRAPNLEFDPQNSQENIEPIAHHAIDIPPEITQHFLRSQDAFQRLLDNTVIDALEKKYGPAASFFQASMNGISVDDKISWQEILIVLFSLSLGGLACFFVVSPSGKAATIIASIIKHFTGYDLVGTKLLKVLKLILQISTTTEAFSLSALSTNNMLHFYFDKQSNEEAFLKETHANWFETMTRVTLKIVYLISAITANVPVYFLASTIWQLSLASATANTGITWKGISDLVASFRSLHPAKQVELDILNEELEKFIKLPSDIQDAIMDKFHDLASKDLPQDEKFKAINLYLLTLSNPSNNTPAPVKEITTLNKSINIATASLCAFTELATFPVQAGVGINSLFKNRSKEPGPVIAGCTTALIAIPPCGGFGVAAGGEFAKYYTGDTKPTASLATPWLRTTFRWMLRPLSLFSGAMFFTLASATANNLISVADIRNEKLAYAIRIILPSVCHVGGCVESDYYTMTALDKLYTYFAQYCSDERTQRLLCFILSARKCYSILAQTNDKNYFSYLNYKMRPGSEIATFLDAAFKLRAPKNYEQIIADIEKFANNGQQQAEAQPTKTTNSLWCHLFGARKADTPAPDIEQGFELQERKQL